MPIGVAQNLDFGNTSRIQNLPVPVASGEAATKSYVDSVAEGLSWKSSARVATTANINIATPGATIDSVTLVSGDRVLVRNQTTVSQNGIYLFDTGSTPLVRSADASTFRELEQAVITIEEGTSSGSTFRQTQINGVIGTNDIIFDPFGTVVPNASETTAGKAEIATQAETDALIDDTRIVTPLKLGNWSGRIRKFASIIGDGSATSYALNHNFNTRDVKVAVFLNSGNYDEVLVQVERPTVNSVNIVFTTAPSLNQFRVVVIG
jgi:hypothetical protein